MNIDLSSFRNLFTDYTELRCQENNSLVISFLKGNNTTNTRLTTSGVSARVYKDGVWGFASSPEATHDGVKFVITTATDNASFLAAKERLSAAPLPRGEVTTHYDPPMTAPPPNPEQLVAFLQEIDQYIAEKYPNLASRTVTFNRTELKKSLLTSEGAAAFSLLTRSLILIGLTVEHDGAPVSLQEVFGGRGQFEDHFSTPDALYPQIDQLYEHLMRKREGVYPAAGLKTCILAPELTGILAHEAIGHTCEADLVLGGSVVGTKLGQPVASPLVSLVDFAHTALGEICPVPIFIDDEGTTATDAVLIDHGILKGFLHNKETARHFQVPPTGNARAFRFSDEPLIRMRNTAILPGEASLEEMIASLDDGYYLMRPSNGQADATSEFMFGVTLGYEVKNGKLGRAIKDTTISGLAFQVLQTVSEVSREFKWLSGGMCGKKQLIPVGLGGPALKCQVMIGGR
ncbi:TldD/PmbA family protein [Capillibacterium thermochitinicola]|uniref:TldD/PmbA family protein n=1 Tax=Capillibacterium thermochitinicola TaxID=2699427 RepID=A0A8J6LJF6_9FIRM|nr:TldD/PmbA family protein [Capillibacterium thermochitinicola]MBA2133730.1 TldD/PmbA family protein [Capillibacterium thermochitinicola]